MKTPFSVLSQVVAFAVLAVGLALAPAKGFANQCELTFAKNPDLPDVADLQNRLILAEARVRELIHSYQDKLFPHEDPFKRVVDLDQAQRIFQSLSFREKNGKRTKSPLGLVNHALSKAYIAERTYNSRLVEWVLEESQANLSMRDLTKKDLQSNLLALRYTIEYLRRYKAPEVVVDREGDQEQTEEKPQKEKKQQEKKEQKEEKKEQEEEDSPPEYPELPEEYRPSTENTERGGGGKKQKQHRAAEVNFKTPFFGQRYFSQIVRGASRPLQQGTLASDGGKPGKFAQTSREMLVRTFGKSRVPLLVPPLFKPLQPSDPRVSITRDETGGYVLESTAVLPEIRIPLVEDQNISLPLPALQALTRPVGFKAEEWPDLVQAEILRKYPARDGQDRPLQVAQAIADHLATKYLYSVGERSEKDPIEALNGGAFQCSMAAYAMIGLLRDVYGIPSRVVGGFRAKSFGGSKDGKSYLVVPQNSGHVWVEVFHDGQWHLFDPTPVKKDKQKEDSEGDKDEYSDIKLENTPDGESDGKPGQEQEDNDASSSAKSDEESPSGPSEENSKQTDHQKRLDENTQKRIDEKKGSGSSESGSKSEQKDDQKGDQESELTKDELADQLELGSLELEPTPDRNALLERAARVLLRNALDVTQTGGKVQGRLNQLKATLKRFSSPELKNLYQKAVGAHVSDHPELYGWLEQTLRLLSKRDVNQTYQELHRIQTAVEAYARLLDRDGKVESPSELVNLIASAKRKIETLSHPDAADMAIVQDLVTDLPTIPRILLKNDYDFSEVGPNAPTRNVAKKLKKGELDDLRLLSILSPISDFILNSTPRPEMIEAKTWQRDSARPRGSDLLPLQRFSDLPRAILGQPGKSLEENMREGTAFVTTRRKRVQIPAGYGKDEAERITIVLYDTSGSMDGDPGTFQAGLISAFTARALSDVTPSGRHRHRVVLVPFDDNVGTPVPVTNAQEALEVLRNYQKKLKNTGGGTDIQKALMQAMSLIADAEKRAGEPLAAANIILMTDGQAAIDAPALYQARKAIDRDTPLQTLFIAINQTNEQLIEFAMDSQRMGIERGFYREFTPEHISDVLKESKETPVKKKEEAFFTDKKASDIPREVLNILEQALREAEVLTRQVESSRRFTPARDHVQELEKLKWRDQAQVERPLEKWLINVRKFARNPIFKDRELLERVVDDLIINFEILTGISKNELSGHEQEQLRHLVRGAAGLEEK